MNILFYDIETSPLEINTWGLYDQNSLNLIKDWQLISFSYKWRGQKAVTCLSQRTMSEKALVKALHKLLDQADIVVAQNGDEFDNKKASAKFIEFGLTPPSSYQKVDTLKTARKYFKFTSNKLDDLGVRLGVGRKLQTGGFDLWLRCLRNERKAWLLMEKYNKQDVILLEKIYDKLLPWMNNHPNVTLYKTGGKCPKCGSLRLKSKGYQYNANSRFKRYYCKDCGGHCSDRLSQKKKPEYVGRG